MAAHSLVNSLKKSCGALNLEFSCAFVEVGVKCQHRVHSVGLCPAGLSMCCISGVLYFTVCSVTRKVIGDLRFPLLDNISI